jgi:eukaryotic-like serine/threonine-protein kinase
LSDVIYNNRYRLDAKIGEGGMAVVYRGYDLILRRQVAIKVLRPKFSADAAFVDRFDFEAQAAAKLSHPNIVQTYDVGKENGDHYIVEEYVAGETLAALEARQGRLPESVAVRYARQICAALAAAHRQEVVHRDVKPSNILITRDDVVRITDFGIAHAADMERSNLFDRGQAEAPMGSLPYCSPEQLSGGPVGEPSDLYSVGVVLYEMLAGKRPFAGADHDALAEAIVNDPAPALDSSASVSAAMAAIVAKLLRKAPHERYQSAGEVLAALRRVTRGEAQDEEDREPTGPDTPTEVLRRRARQTPSAVHVVLPPEPAAPVWRANRAIAWAAGLVAVFVLVALLVAARQASSHSLRVPDLSGKSVAEAVTALHALGIDAVAIKQQPDPTVQGGLIAGTDPALNTTVGRDSQITLLVSDGPPTVEVPNVLGQEPKGAQEFLVAQGFAVHLGKPVHSATIKQGLVAATNPAPGSPLGKGVAVVISVSAGPEMVSVPNVVSMDEDSARSLLAKLGLKLAVNSEVAVNNIPAHVILSQDPSERSGLAPGGTVMVDVSGGPAAIEVPQVVGQSMDAARQTLVGAGLAVGNIVQAAVPDKPAGTVLSQTPGAFARVSEGAAIDLVVAAGDVASPGASGAPALSPVPNVVGMSVDQAKAALERGGYHLDRVTVLPGSPADAKVLSSDPAAGTTPPSGNNGVSLVIGK